MEARNVERHLLFVYGTLKQGFCRHYALAEETFLGTAQTEPLYRMVNVGTYPGLLHAIGNGRAILGEVWEVSAEALIRLDIVEGTDDGLYERKKVKLQGDEYASVDAYFYLGNTDECPDCGDFWA